MTVRLNFVIKKFQDTCNVIMYIERAKHNQKTRIALLDIDFLMACEICKRTCNTKKHFPLG